MGNRIDRTPLAGEYKPVINLNTLINLIFATPRIFKVEQSVLDVSIEFPDISFWQGTINWDTMATKTGNIIIRMGQRTWADRMFYPNWIAAHRRNIKRSAYWFYDGTVSPQSQFAVIDGLLHAAPPEGRIWIDWETNFGGGHEGLKNVVALMELVEGAYPNNEIGLYTGYYFFIANSNVITNASQYSYLSKKPLWLAQYGVDSSRLRVPRPWVVPELHQYGTPVIGESYGCQSKELDMNRVISNFPIYVTGEEPTVPLPPKGDVMITPITAKQMKTTASVLNIRNSPGATSAESDIGNMPKDTIVEVDATAYVNPVMWYRLLNATGPNGAPIATSDGSLVSQRRDCWASGTFLIDTNVPIPPSIGTPVPPQEIRIKDANGIWWRSTTFERVI